MVLVKKNHKVCGTDIRFSENVNSVIFSSTKHSEVALLQREICNCYKTKKPVLSETVCSGLGNYCFLS